MGLGVIILQLWVRLTHCSCKQRVGGRNNGEIFLPRRRAWVLTWPLPPCVKDIRRSLLALKMEHVATLILWGHMREEVTTWRRRHCPVMRPSRPFLLIPLDASPQATSLIMRKHEKTSDLPGSTASWHHACIHRINDTNHEKKVIFAERTVHGGLDRLINLWTGPPFHDSSRSACVMGRGASTWWHWGDPDIVGVQQVLRGRQHHLSRWIFLTSSKHPIPQLLA